MRNKDQFRGCLVGGAVGDALGYAVEFLDEQEIFDRYGKNGITAYTLCDSVAEISDDRNINFERYWGRRYSVRQRKRRRISGRTITTRKRKSTNIM